MHGRVFTRSGMLFGRMFVAIAVVAAFTMVAAPTSAWAAATFDPKADYPAGNGPASVAITDLDGEGDQDLVTANRNSGTVSVLLNNGDGTFAPKADYGVGAFPRSVAAADLDGDGDLDLAAANQGSSNVSVLINTTGPRADLSVTQSDSVDPATVGEDLTYTFTVTNQGPATATNTTLTDKLPSGLSFVSANTSRGSCSESGGTVSCSLGTLARNATATVQIVVEPTDSSSPSVSNTARVQSERADFDQADNSDTEKTAINQAPAASDDSYSTEEDRTLRVAAPGVLGNDTDANSGETLTAEAITDPAHGTLFLRTNGSFAYLPDSGYSGSDSFTYEVSDGKGGTDTATVSLTINAANEAPDAQDDSATTEEDTATNIDVLTNDSDPAHGSATVASDGKSVRYQPDSGYSGSDSFTYTISDGQGGTDTATVTITVNAANEAPVASNDSYTIKGKTLTVPVASGVLKNDTDPDGDSLTGARVVSGPSKGTLTLNAGGSFTYEGKVSKKAPVTFVYEASDGKGGTDQATVTIKAKKKK